MNKNYYLGIDIGTYETKGVLVDIEGKIIAQSFKRHELIVPQKGWQSIDLWKIGGMILFIYVKI